MIGQWAQEGINTELVRRVPGRRPGLYWITTDAKGERSFAYWRQEAPARELFDDATSVTDLRQSLTRFGLVHITGITLSLYSRAARVRLYETLLALREQGVLISFDGNYRPAAWASVTEAQEAFEQTARLSHLVLGGNGCVIGDGAAQHRVRTQAIATPVDTTAAGDAFNAAYLAARYRGEPPSKAAQHGNQLAGAVIMYRGAIIPREFMP